MLAAALVNVVAMDFAYRVGAVTYALTLLLVDTVILSPYLRPLFEILLVRGSGGLPFEPFGQLRRRHWPIAKAALICALALPLIAINMQRRRSFFGSGHLVYGLFDVTRFVRNGQAAAPVGDGTAWKRVASDPRDGTDGILVQLGNGDLQRFELGDDSAHHVWTIRAKDQRPAGKLTYSTRPDGAVSLDGRIGNDSLDILLRPVDVRNAFPLLGPA